MAASGGIGYVQVYALMLLSYVNVRVCDIDALVALVSFAVTDVASEIGAPVAIFLRNTAATRFSPRANVCFGLFSSERISPNMSTVFTEKDMWPIPFATR